MERRLTVCPGIRGTDLHAELCHEFGYDGSHPVFQRQLRLLRPAVVRDPEIRFETGPGMPRPTGRRWDRFRSATSWWSSRPWWPSSVTAGRRRFIRGRSHPPHQPGAPDLVPARPGRRDAGGAHRPRPACSPRHCETGCSSSSQSRLRAFFWSPFCWASCTDWAYGDAQLQEALTYRSQQSPVLASASHSASWPRSPIAGPASTNTT